MFDPFFFSGDFLFLVFPNWTSVVCDSSGAGSYMCWILLYFLLGGYPPQFLAYVATSPHDPILTLDQTGPILSATSPSPPFLPFLIPMSGFPFSTGLSPAPPAVDICSVESTPAAFRSRSPLFSCLWPPTFPGALHSFLLLRSLLPRAGPRLLQRGDRR